jgi:hypothetical protein
VIVYGHHAYRLGVQRFVTELDARLSHLPTSPGRDTIVDLLVDLGEASSAVIDALCPVRDDDVDRLRPWSDTLHGVARALAASVDHDQDGVRKALTASQRAAAVLDAATDMRHVPARTAEGFAHYSLYPEQYVVAAERFLESHDPRSVTCIGIRTIGVPLAHVVAATVERRGIAARVFTVRPRGHPFDRHLAISERLRRRICESAATHYAIVDEGPGLSGSSFAAVSEELLVLGIEADRIVLFPSWTPQDASLRSQRGQRAWDRHVRITASFEDVFAPDPTSDVSAGRWRRRVFGHDETRWPAVNPQHEKRKYLHTNATQWVSRFAGLGRHGRAKLRRAETLADAGFTTQPEHLGHGFLTQAWVAGTPLDMGDGQASDVLDRLASYLAFLRRTFATGRRASVGDLVEMMQVNALEGLDAERVPAIDVLGHDASAFDEPQIGVDGRMLPHEWLSTASGLVKTDALDHHADDFFPGSRDIAWDVAGAIVEFGLDTNSTARLVTKYRARSGDRTITRRVPFYEAAYLAYRLGYTTLASEALGSTAEGARFARLTARYRHSLAALSPPRRSVARR